MKHHLFVYDCELKCYYVEKEALTVCISCGSCLTTKTQQPRFNGNLLDVSELKNV